MLDIARREGVRVEERTLFHQDLDNATVWILSALHGIRQATTWVDGPHPFPARSPCVMRGKKNGVTKAREYTSFLAERNIP